MWSENMETVDRRNTLLVPLLEEAKKWGEGQKKNEIEGGIHRLY